MGCIKCVYFKKADWKGLRPFKHFGIRGIDQIIFRVRGFCRDSGNPCFNEFAKIHGRGVGKIEALFTPKFCRYKKHKKRL